MDILLTHKALSEFLQTDCQPPEIARLVSMCGPTFDRIHQLNDDYLYEIEVITNRIDCASALGIAREANAILNQFGINSKLVNLPKTQKLNSSHPELPVTIKIDDESLVKRFTAVTISEVNVKTSPKATQELLTQCGQSPINNLVDITNETTLLYGLPTHIFDLDKIQGAEITIRQSAPEETIVTLDHQKHILKGGDIVIADKNGNLIDLCGIMGGELAMVDESTKNILLIAPIYNPKPIRNTSLYLQKRTLAAQIFEKLPDTELALPVISSSIKLFLERASGWQSSKILDINFSPLKKKIIKIDLKWLESFVGISIPSSKIISILSFLGFESKKLKDSLSVNIPSFRQNDINLQEDVAEEIARVYGYHQLPSIIPFTTTKDTSPNSLIKNELKIKEYLYHLGFNEILNNSLISEALLSQSDRQSDYKLTNALSSDYLYLRPSLLPGLLQSYKNNLGKGHKEISIFELSNVYLKTNINQNLPQERSTLSIISDRNYFQVKAIIQNSLKLIGYKNISFIKTKSPQPNFDLENTADIKIDNQTIGSIGVLNQKTINAYSLPNQDLAIVEIDFDKLNSIQPTVSKFNPVSLFPEVIEDINITSTQPIGDLITAISNTSILIKDAIYISSFQNSHLFKVTFSSSQEPLTKEQVATIKSQILAKLSE